MRRYLQFRLRTLFVVITIAAITCAVSAPSIVLRFREYQREQEHLKARRELEAWIDSLVGWESPPIRPQPDDRPPE